VRQVCGQHNGQAPGGMKEWQVGRQGRYKGSGGGSAMGTSNNTKGGNVPKVVQVGISSVCGTMCTV